MAMWKGGMMASEVICLLPCNLGSLHIYDTCFAEGLLLVSRVKYGM